MVKSIDSARTGVIKHPTFSHPSGRHPTTQFRAIFRCCQSRCNRQSDTLTLGRCSSYPRERTQLLQPALNPSHHPPRVGGEMHRIGCVCVRKMCSKVGHLLRLAVMQAYVHLLAIQPEPGRTEEEKWWKTMENTSLPTTTSFSEQRVRTWNEKAM